MQDQLKVVKVGENEYGIGRLNAFQQLHVARRLLPVLARIGTAFQQSGSDGSADPFSVVANPMAQAISDMKQEDVDYVLNTCLAICHRKVQQGNGVGWAALMSPGGEGKLGQLMFQDLDLSHLIELVGAVVMENLKGFFPTAQPESPGGKTA